MLLGTKLQSLKACMVTQRSITVTQGGRGGERADRRQAQKDQSRNAPRGEKQLTPFNQLSCRHKVSVLLQARQQFPYEGKILTYWVALKMI